MQNTIITRGTAVLNLNEGRKAKTARATQTLYLVTSTFRSVRALRSYPDATTPVPRSSWPSMLENSIHTVLTPSPSAAVAGPGGGCIRASVASPSRRVRSSSARRSALARHRRHGTRSPAAIVTSLSVAITTLLRVALLLSVALLHAIPLLLSVPLLLHATLDARSAPPASFWHVKTAPSGLLASRLIWSPLVR